MQYMVLQNVATMSTRPRYVCALLEEFLHQAHQPHPDKTLKLEALTNLAIETNICNFPTGMPDLHSQHRQGFCGSHGPSH